MGDTAYFSPERMANYMLLRAKNKNVTPFDPAKVDTWAMGLTLLELVLDQPPKGSLVNIPERISHHGGLGAAVHDIAGLICCLLDVSPEKRFNADQALAHSVFQRKDLFMSPKEKKQAFSDLYDASKHIKEPIMEKVSDEYTDYAGYNGSASPMYSQAAELLQTYSDPSVLTTPGNDSPPTRAMSGKTKASSRGTMPSSTAVKYREVPAFWNKKGPDTQGKLSPSSKKVISNDDSSSSCDELSKSL
jgi:serine/threonine protein kinase